MFDLIILTPENIYFKGQVQSVTAPGSLGYLEILTNHAPIITLLKKGQVLVKDADKIPHTYTITGGFLEVHRNRASLLADDIEVSSAPPLKFSGLT